MLSLLLTIISVASGNSRITIVRRKKMTAEKLRQKPIGILERRSLTINYNNHKFEEHYSLVKSKTGKYFIGFSDDGSYCSNVVSENEMVNLINNRNYSDREAIDIYMQSPNLSCCMDVF